MTISPWISVLTALEPEYNKLKQMLEDGPKISVEIEKRSSSWWIKVFEDWGDLPYDQQYYNPIENKITECIQWSEEQLGTWSSVNRMSYNQWAFRKKQDAEKFITLFNLVWVQ